MSIDLSLDRIRVLLTHLPTYTRPTCHISGTNGKGSVSAFISSILLASDPPLSVGRFNSPHLISIHDSITIDNKPVSSASYDAAREQVVLADRTHTIGASNFELLTATALLLFETTPVDIVVLEVGMGGRLDATNIIPTSCVIASVLTAVDLDHQAFLGSTVSAIAREKAAIARPNRPFILGPQKHAEVEAVVRDIVQQAGGIFVPPCTIATRQWPDFIDGDLPSVVSFSPTNFHPPPPRPIEAYMPCFNGKIRAPLPLHGDHQFANLGTALAVISSLLTSGVSATFPRLRLHTRIMPATVAAGVKSTSWPGRLSYHKLTLGPSSSPQKLIVLADGAHNPASAATLSDYLSSLLSAAPRVTTLTFLLALSHSPPKTPRETLMPLLAPLRFRNNLSVGVAALPFSPPDGMPWVKPVPADAIRQVAAELVPDAELWSAADDAQLPAALAWAAERQKRQGGEGLIVVAGSLYLVADFYRLLKSGT